MDICRVITYCYGAKIHAFVLMSNHYHMLLSTPDENLDDIMQYFQREFSSWIRNQTQKQKYRFQGRYKYCLLTEHSHFINTFRYIYQNPLRSGLTSHAEDYKFSTLHGISGNGLLECPVWLCKEFGGAIPEDHEDLLSFINHPFRCEASEKTRRALRRQCYKEPLRLQ